MLHVAVVAAPDSRNAGTEVGMVKAALLYADKVTLYSPTSSMLAQFSELKNFSFLEQIVFINQMAESLGKPPLNLEVIDQALYTLKNGTRAQRRKIERFFNKANKKTDPNWQQVLGAIETFKEKLGITEVVQAVESGAIGIHSFTYEGANGKPDDDMVKQFTSVALSSIHDSGVLPLFDAPTNQLIRAGIKEGVYQIPQHDMSRGNPIALASFLFNQLPTWEKASISELLDIRKELDKPLIRFRAGVSKLVAQKSISQWDKEFEEESNRILLEEIKPAILEIEELIQSNKYLRQLANAFFSDPKALTAVLGLAVASFTDLGSMLMGDKAELVGLGASALTGLSKAYEAEQKRKGQQKEAEAKEFYLYYHLQQRLPK